MLLILLLSASHLVLSHPLSRQSNGLGECRKSVISRALEVLPGGGWDNLRNLDMGRVMNFSYSLCRTTEDGVYLIPDEVFVIPQKVSGVETNSEIVSSWLDQKSTTSHSINAHVSFFHVLNGRFSVENKRMKLHQVRDTAVTARVQVRNHLYTVRVHPDFTLDSRFAYRAEEIADAIENNQTRQAAYLSEKLVLDYGTHVITTVEAGASLVQEDYLRSSYVSDTDTSRFSVSASAGVNFFNKVNIGIGSDNVQKTSEIQGYQNNLTYSLTLSHGGTLFYPGITLQKWQESTVNNLVAIDRAGMPLHYYFTRQVFPDLPEPTILKLATSVRQAIERYYSINKRPGCVKPDSQNFNFQANVDDGSCKGPATNLSFGAVYQQCTKLTNDADPICEAQAQKNPGTGDYACPAPFRPTLLHSEVVEEGYNQYECHDYCSCWVFCCKKRSCGNVYYVRRARIDTYWCSTNNEVEEYSGYLFGGLYSPTLQNPLTKSNSCPPSFVPLKFLASGLVVCVSNDYEIGARFSVPFGGFFSCKSGNPLMRGESRCPVGFSQHLAAISDGCQVLYCVQSGIFTGGELLPINLPPFTRSPIIFMVPTNTVAVRTQGDKAWVRIGETNMWKTVKVDNLHSYLYDPEMSGGEKFGVAVGVIALVALVAVVVVVVVRRKRGGTRPLIGRGYEELSSEVQAAAEVEIIGEGSSDDPTQALLH